MKALVLANHQAAVGKSTVATLLVRHLARRGHRVLAIDLCHPGRMGASLRRSDMTAVVPLADDALTGDEIPSCPGAPGQPIVLIDGAGRWLDLDLQARRGRHFVENLQDLLGMARNHFDACVIDTSARPDVRLLAALACADLVLVPTPLAEPSIGRLGYLFWHARCGIYAIQASFNPRLRVFGLLPTMVGNEGIAPHERARIARLANLPQAGFIQIDDEPSADRREPLWRPAGETAYIPHSPQLARTLGSGQMPWEIPATAARAVWRQIRPSIETLADRLTDRLPKRSSPTHKARS
jgi:cellulose biosynthesis protein BcsQ